MCEARSQADWTASESDGRVVVLSQFKANQIKANGQGTERQTGCVSVPSATKMK